MIDVSYDFKVPFSLFVCVCVCVCVLMIDFMIFILQGFHYVCLSVHLFVGKRTTYFLLKLSQVFNHSLLFL